MSRKHHHHRDRARSNMRHNLKVGAILAFLALLAVRLLTWISLDKVAPKWILGLRIGLIVTIIVGLVGGVILLIGVMQWMRIKSGL